MSTNLFRKMNAIQVPAKIQSLTNDKLKLVIETRAKEHYNQEPYKPLQVETVMSLLQGRNTFLLAATGFGKSRISKMFLDLLPKDHHCQIMGVVVVNGLHDVGRDGSSRFKCC
jgi:hypothetical protein